ncbi:MAG: class I SAM-dependent methyltransferase [Armatimonadetes bacterium]|nr:class I SAM-dependent methyltransferase [Armatimonadota bacterium]
MNAKKASSRMYESQRLYDRLADTYDLMIDWEARLKRESPLLRRWFEETGARRVLDAGSGTGQHSRLFAGWGLEVVGADPSPDMAARSRAESSGLKVDYVEAGFGELASRCGNGFDAVVCLGNSLPHVLTAKGVNAALKDFADTLRPGGLLVVHGNNYDAVLGNQDRFMPPAQARQGDTEYLFLRFFDLGPRLLTFHVITLMKKEGRWRQHIEATPHRPLLRADLERRLRQAGFKGIEFYGSWNGDPYEPLKSDHQIVKAVKG